jgi:hypothetical protein
VSAGAIEQDGTKKARGIPGRVFVICFVPILVLLSALTFGMGYRFQVIMNRLEQVRSLWPNASLELKARYDRLEKSMMDSNIEPAKLAELTKLRSSFDQASQFDAQSVAAASLEQAIPSLTENAQWGSEDFQLAGLTKLLASDRERASVQNDMLGWLTIRGLRLKLPPIFDPNSLPKAQ